MNNEFFTCLARAVLRHAPRALLSCVPFGEALYDIARDTMSEWRQCRSAAERRAELEELASSTPENARTQASAVVAETTCSVEQRQALAGYLERLPGLVRRSLSRPEDMTGRTVPAGMPLERAEDIVPFLPPRPPRFQPGARLVGQTGQQWELLELVGNGGFGEVWRAMPRDAADQQEVAVKFCLDAQAATTLRTEAALLRRVATQGPSLGLVALRESHLQADPPFLVYDYIPGGDLTRLIRGWHPRGERPARLDVEATRLIHYLALTLGVAHGLNPPVVHRDLKPSNILLEPTAPGRVRPRVADFGIGAVAAKQALLRATTTSQKEMLTTCLRGAHTPLYASPQQLEGCSAQPADDVYALGVIWYQVLTGDTLVGPPTDWRAELADRRVSPRVLDVLGRCLATAPQRRPADATALAGTLQDLLPRVNGAV